MGCQSNSSMMLFAILVVLGIHAHQDREHTIMLFVEFAVVGMSAW